MQLRDNLIKGENMKVKFRTLELAEEIYKEASQEKLRAPLNNQYQRALLSAVLNLSEGSAKFSWKDKARFYNISYGSLQEVRTILKLANISKYDDQMDKLCAWIYKLTRAVGGS